MRDAPDSCAQRRSSSIGALLLGSLLTGATVFAGPAQAAHSPARHQAAQARGIDYPVHHSSQNAHGFYLKRVAEKSRGAGSKLTKNGKSWVYGRHSAALQCVPFARAASGIELKGDAVNWWDAAAGVYQRGNRPEPGAVLNFRANGNMRLGHVAVVRRIVSNREIEIDHANWAYSGKGNISRGVAVIDVSARNDWTAVRVQLGHGDEFGSIYSTYGFIYDRPDNGTMVANSAPAAGAPTREVSGYDEVAEAPSHTTALYDAPARSVR